ncbi:hypothetical protein F2Q68_00043034 [Brassica cretica]|uniref:Uncharacterized protein n=2 Tax=Brassica cretica TaxID=69181 RepID=A0ABQ7AZI7_BRACR|nr:hypothetical protein F2Q68_00043034 [Brassica cretica]KAF3519501.1 hypothetical protein DY000_02058514 [Brassica cretica]
MHRIDRQQHPFVDDTRLPPSTETTLPSTAHTHPTSIDIPPWISIDTEPRDMVATIVLIQDATGNLHDQEGHLRNAACQKIDDQGDVIRDIAADQAADDAARPRTLADYKRPDQYYENRSSIRPPAIQRQPVQSASNQTLATRRSFQLIRR